MGGTLGGVGVHSRLEADRGIAYVETLGMHLNAPAAGELDKHSSRVVMRAVDGGGVIVEVASRHPGSLAYRHAWNVLNWLEGSVSCQLPHDDRPDPRLRPSVDQSEWRTKAPETMAVP